MPLMILALLVVALAPWCAPGVTQPFPGPVLVAGGGLAILGALTRASPRRALLPMLMLLWWALCERSSVDPYRSMLSLASLTGATAVTLTLIATVTTRKRWRGAAHTLVAAAGILCLSGLGQPPLHATFSNPDSLCPLPLTGALLALGLMPRARKHELVYLMLQSAFLMACVALTGSRAGLLALAVGLLIWVLRRAPFFTLAPVALGLGVLLLTGSLGHATERIGILSQGKDSQGLLMRQDVLVYGLQTAFHYSLLGSGPGTFALAYQEFRPTRPEAEFPASMYVNVAHDDWVEVAVETGWLGLLLWVCVQGSALKSALTSKTMRHEANGILSCLAAMAVFSSLNFVLALPALLLWWFALIGLGLSLPHEPKPLYRWLFPPVLVIAGVLTLALGIRLTRANHFLAIATQRQRELRWEESLQALDQAVKALPERPRTYAQRARVRISLAQLGPEHPEEVTRDLLQAYRLSPRDPESLRGRTDYLKLRGDLEGAETMLRVAHRQMPYQDWVLKDLLAVQVLQQKLPDACQTLRELSRHEPAYLERLAAVLALQPRQGVEQLELWRDWSEADRLAESAARQAPLEFYGWLSRRHPDNLHYLWMLAQVSPDRQALIERILASGREGDPAYELALVATRQPGRLERFLQNHPERTEARLALASLCKTPERAREVLAEGLQANGSEPRLLARMGTLLLEEGTPDLARDYFQRALELDPQNAEAKAGIPRTN